MKTIIIAEIGINHGGSVKRAKKLIVSAKKSGADLVKFQTYTAERRVSADNPAFGILKECELTYDQQLELKEFSEEAGIEFFSTAFDVDALKFLTEDLGLRRVKLASFDTTNIEFLRAVNGMAKRYNDLNVILSTGMTSRDEFYDAVCTLEDVKDRTILHCKSAYPPAENQLNFGVIKMFKNLNEATFGRVTVGYSNHVKDALIPALSVLAGAEVIEAHFMIDAKDKCCDAQVSLDSEMFKQMVSNVRRFEAIMGDGIMRVEECEKETLIFKRHSR